MEKLEHEKIWENIFDEAGQKSYLSTMKEITHDSQAFHLAEKDWELWFNHEFKILQQFLFNDLTKTTFLAKTFLHQLVFDRLKLNPADEDVMKLVDFVVRGP